MKNPSSRWRGSGVQGDNVGLILTHCRRSATWDHKGENVDDLPEWAGRHVLAEALEACGLPVVRCAMWRRPHEGWMTYADRLSAIALVCRVIAEARRRLPAGVSGLSLDRRWRDAAWRCTVAGLAMLDADPRERLVAGEVSRRRLSPRR